ncbi:MAG: mechanosensitive ion channel [Gammaproteobacteria bacterium]|nr:mechanosensitive ion channel [Gammaproteobacteria bacterium]
MSQLNEFLGYSILTFADRTITVGQIILIPFIIIVGYFIARLVGRVLVKKMVARSVNPDLIHLVQRLYFIIILVVIAITALELLNVPLAAFAFISGAIAIGVGFGAQNIINNFISGWILLWERPIRIGDFLEVGDTRGTVEAINTRSTRIKRTDGVHLLIPNSQLLENTVVNWTLIDRLARAQVRVGVAYGSPVRQVSELIDQAVSEHADILTDPAPAVIFEDFGDSALIFDAYFWVMAGGDRDLRKIRSDLRFRIDALFKEHDITIAFPQRDVHFDAAHPIKVSLVGSDKVGAEGNAND